MLVFVYLAPSIRHQAPRLRPSTVRVPRPLEAVPDPVGRLSVREELQTRRLEPEDLHGLLDEIFLHVAVLQRCLEIANLADEGVPIR